MVALFGNLKHQLSNVCEKIHQVECLCTHTHVHTHNDGMLHKCYASFYFHFTVFWACITHSVCMSVNMCVCVECVMFIHWKTNTIIRYNVTTLLYTAVLFHLYFSSLFSLVSRSIAAAVAVAAFIKASGIFLDFCWLPAYKHTCIHCVHTCIFMCVHSVQCTHTAYGHTNTPFFGLENLFYRVAECQLSKSFLL